MVLAAKDDHLPDCVNVPERPAEEEETIEVEVTDETPGANTISDEELEGGQTGNLLAPEEFGEAVEKKKEPKKKKVKVSKEKKPTFLNIVWKTVKGAALDMYDKANEE